MTRGDMKPDTSPRALAVEHSTSVLDNLGHDLIREKKISVTGDAKESAKSTADSSQMAGRDLLTTLSTLDDDDDDDLKPSNTD